jgi:putative salt-induced outer membrane protein YdiY
MISALWILGAFAPAEPAATTLVVEPQPLSSFVAEDAPKPVMDRWNGSIAVGAIYEDGNTDERSVNATGKAEYRREIDRWTVAGYWDYGESKDQTTGDWLLTSRKAGLAVNYDYFLTKKVYVSGNASVDTDVGDDIQMRTFFGASIGYQWREDEKLKWNSASGTRKSAPAT